MSRTLSSLLGVEPRDFSSFISRLEHVTHNDGVDVRLTAEIITKSREAVRGLGLDPKDSTHEEVYAALRARVLSSDESLRKELKIAPATSGLLPSEKQAAEDTAKIATALSTLIQNDRVICIQPAAIKRILKAVPPKKTLKKLGFRSIASVLRREDPRAFYALAFLYESESWKNQVTAHLKRLHAKDVVEQSPEIVSLPKDWIKKLGDEEFRKVSLSVSEIGVVVILPSVPLSSPATVLLTCAVTLQSVQTMVVESLPYRSQALTTGIENLIPEIAAGHVKILEKIHGLQPSWHAVYRLFATHTKQIPEFEFVLQDLSWETTETRLASFCSDLDYWVDKHYLGYKTHDLPLSFHVIDIAVSEVLDKQWGEQIVSHMRASLWNELQLHYLKHEALERSVINQLTIAQEVVL